MCVSYTSSLNNNKIHKYNYYYCLINAMIIPSSAEPVILEFPDDVNITEGERMCFRVKVRGDPDPSLTWYHNGHEVEADYAIELGEDGSLTIASSELKHTGSYQLVVANNTGSIKREVKLCVHQEGEESSATEGRRVELSPILVQDFGRHVADSHAMNNRGFRKQYAVSM